MGSTASSPDKRRVLALALIAAVPTFLLHAGELNADTKLYLTSNPGRLLSSAAKAWDPSQFLGYVPHQAVGYLWPMGPFFWLGDVLGAPDWIMQRLWLTVIFAAAGTGVYFFLRRLGFRPDAALAGAIFFQVTPYVLSYQSRTSVMLLPWAATGWLALITARGCNRRSWRDPILIALIVFTVGGINATALVMIAPVVLIVALHNRGNGRASNVFPFLIRTAVLSALVSTWWISMLAIQARYGAAVLSYSETLEAVSSTSTSFEVLRGMGYWLNYVVNGSDYGTTTAVDLLSSPYALVASCVIPLAGLLWLALSRDHRVRQASALVLAGLVLSTGAYGMAQSSLLMRLLAGNADSSVALALRSSTRAIPLLLLGLAIAWAGATQWSLSRRALGSRHHRYAGSLATGAVLLVSMPSLRTHGVIDPALSRPSRAPVSWNQLHALLQESSAPSSRVVQAPGQEFGAYDWGFTVDPVWPSVSARPLATRDLLPLGGPQAMDLLYAFDDAVQNGFTTDAGARATATRLGAGAVLLAGDLDEERFHTTSPTEAIRENRLSIDATIPFDAGEHSVILNPSTSLATVSSDIVQLSGSGVGLVSADARGLIGDRLVRYTADQSDDAISESATSTIPLIVTDSNRIQARHWRTSYDTLGYSEDATDLTRPLTKDTANRRLDPFPTNSSSVSTSERTLVRQIGPVTARATSYGTPLLYWPEHRASAAIDGDLATAWRTSAYANPTGQTIRLTSTSPFTEVRLVQPTSPHEDRWITQVSYALDHGDFVERPLDLSSRHIEGQVLRLPTPARTIDIRIDLVGWSVNGEQEGLDGVGFAEIDLGLPLTSEETTLPLRALEASPADRPIAYTFTRERARTTSEWRHDPEVDLRRRFLVPGDTTVRGTVTGSLALDADERLAAPTLGVTSFASGRKTRDFSTAGWLATDGDMKTMWVGPPGAASGTTLSFQMDSTASGTIDQPDADEYSRIRRALLSDGRQVEIVQFDAMTGRGSFTARTLRPGRWTLTVTEIEPRTSLDTRTNTPLTLPVAIADIRSAGLRSISPALPTADDGTLPLVLNGEELRLNVAWGGTVNRPRFTAQVPDVSLRSGLASLSSPSLHDTGVVIDELTLVNSEWTRRANLEQPTTPIAVSSGSTEREVAFPGCETECWFVFAESHNRGWSARLDGVDLGEPQPINGGFNGWAIPADTPPGNISLRYEPQRWLSLGLAITALSVLCSLVTLLVGRRQRQNATVATVDRTARPVYRQRTLTTAQTILAVVASAILVAVAARPVYAIAAVVLFLLASDARRRVWVRRVTATWLMASMSLALLRVLVVNPPIRFDWPTESAFVHWHLLACIMIITILKNLTTLSDVEVKSGHSRHN